MGKNSSTTDASVRTDKPLVCCPAELKPCDVSALVLEVSFKGVRTGETEEVEIQEKVKVDFRMHEIVRRYRDVGMAGNRRLAKFDAVVEVLADHPTTREGERMKDLISGEGSPVAKEKARLSAHAEFVGLRCFPALHGVISLKPLTATDKAEPVENQAINQPEVWLPPQYLAARRFPVLDDPVADVVHAARGSTSGIGVILRLFQAIFESLGPREFEVLAQGCGDRGELKDPHNRELRALLRVFRRDTWSIGLKIPPLGERSYTKSADKNYLTGAKETSDEKQARILASSSTETTNSETARNGVSTTTTERTKWDGKKGEKFESERTQFGEIARVEPPRGPGPTARIPRRALSS